MNQERKMSKQLQLNGQDSVDIGKEEDELYEKNDLSVHEHFNNTDEEIDIPDIGFFPKELVLEEQRLKEDHTKKDEESLVNDLDEKEKRVRFQNLLTLLKNSTKLSNLFESRLKICKIQIIKKELGNAMTMKENVPNYKDESTKNTDNQPIVQPKLFHGNLKAHQIEGLLWIRTLYENGLNGILADEMGLEFSKFSPKLPTVLYHGTESERFQLRSKFNSTHKVNKFKCQPVVITTYDVVRRDITYLKNIDWKFITIDEGQKVKNANSQISTCMRAFNCTNKLILTGTPIQNDMSELWSLLNWLMPKMFDQLEDFNSWFVIDKFFDSNDKIVNMVKKDELLDIILKILKPFILRREKNETDLNLPPKKEIVIYAPLTETQKQLYEATLNKQMEILLNKKKNPQVDLQAQDRCHRMGQTKPVVVYRFCSKNTIDERILNFATAKRKLEKVIIGSGSFSRTATLTMSSIEDLMTLLKSSEYTKKIQPNGFILSDEELDAILDRSDMYNPASMTLASHTAEHFKVLTNS
ncbi:unnamed protein product [Macrosiphum euphorbiae]|uniref:Helicase ATP-binding domain-containing protein n=1 Tax=Macrosiphum euphorbiae TaxID=13131 RepID=A0AAV0YAA6_9HEMI|nr:unnamed protein product [Macrosiphum euphorbiae]